MEPYVRLLWNSLLALPRVAHAFQYKVENQQFANLALQMYVV